MVVCIPLICVSNQRELVQNYYRENAQQITHLILCKLLWGGGGGLFQVRVNQYNCVFQILSSSQNFIGKCTLCYLHIIALMIASLIAFIVDLGATYYGSLVKQL